MLTTDSVIILLLRVIDLMLCAGVPHGQCGRCMGEP